VIGKTDLRSDEYACRANFQRELTEFVVFALDAADGSEGFADCGVGFDGGEIAEEGFRWCGRGVMLGGLRWFLEESRLCAQGLQGDALGGVPLDFIVALHIGIPRSSLATKSFMPTTTCPWFRLRAGSRTRRAEALDCTNPIRSPWIIGRPCASSSPKKPVPALRFVW